MTERMTQLSVWLGSSLVRYYLVTGHPGHGTPMLRVRLYEVQRQDEEIRSKKVVTEDGPVAEGAATIERALRRWEAGEYDPIPVSFGPRTPEIPL